MPRDNLGILAQHHASRASDLDQITVEPSTQGLDRVATSGQLERATLGAVREGLIRERAIPGLGDCHEFDPIGMGMTQQVRVGHQRRSVRIPIDDRSLAHHGVRRRWNGLVLQGAIEQRSELGPLRCTAPRGFEFGVGRNRGRTDEPTGDRDQQHGGGIDVAIGVELGQLRPRPSGRSVGGNPLQRQASRHLRGRFPGELAQTPDPAPGRVQVAPRRGDEPGGQ